MMVRAFGLPNCFPNVLPSREQRSGVLGVALVHGANAIKANAPSLDGCSRRRHTYCGLLAATVDAQVDKPIPV
jgi:hypothetical protein